METIRLTVRGGKVRGIYSDALADLLREGDAETVRASHVEPAPNGAGWVADMSPSGGPVLPARRTRKAALRAEVAWLRKNRDL